MLSSYPIVDIPADAPEDIEQMGSKAKFWFRREEERWLFKYPRPGTGEHWAEKIVAEISTLLGIPAARVELATYQGLPGSASLSFADRAKGRALVHGNEILAALVEGYDKTKWHRQSDHTLERIIEAVSVLFPAEHIRSALLRLAEYVVLDALVGNVDRHHENWGVLLRLPYSNLLNLEVAPSFDHASSLGRELTPERCSALLGQPDGVRKYMQKGHGGIFLKGTDTRGASPLRLAVEARRLYPEYFIPCLARVEALDMDQIEAIVQRIPVGWMPEYNRSFAVRFVDLARGLLLEEA